MKWLLLFYMYMLTTAIIIERQARKQLSMKHTFLEQLCTPDDLNFSKQFTIYYSMSTQPTHTEIQRQYLDSASGVHVSYTVMEPVKPQLWIETIVVDKPEFLRRYTIQNATLTTIQIHSENVISCIDFRYYALFSGVVYAEYDIRVDW